MNIVSRTLAKLTGGTSGYVRPRFTPPPPPYKVNPMSKLVNVTAANGVNFNVRLIEEGDRYGLNMCLVHDRPSLSSGTIKPMVAFYDTKSQFHYDYVGEPEDAKAAGAVCLGQFVSHYYVDTLLENIETTNGLRLHGGIPRWQIDGDALRKAFVELDIWSPPVRKEKLVITWDSEDPDREPQLWVPPGLAENVDLVVLNKSQELGGRFPNTDPADIDLLEAGTNGTFPGYIQLQ